jgi:hypothetical protein
MPEASSVYDVNGPFLRARGYYVHPIGPNTKEPQYYVPSENRYRGIENWAHEGRPMETSPQPDAGIGLRTGKQPNGDWVIAIDWDNEDAAIASMDDPELTSAVSKQGRRGFTTFHRSLKEVPSRDFRVGGVVAVQVLSDGRQTVLPPSVHPDTKRPYTWADKYTLYTCNVSDLPALPDGYVERIKQILRPLGYEPEPERVQTNGHDSGEAENPFQELNDRAMRELVKWVPDLKLYGCRRLSGPTASYEAVATWRPSSTGRPVEQRKRNLRISGKRGIKDFGTGEGFSPINLVMRALGYSRSDAVGWLQERVLPKGPPIDFDAIIGRGSKPQGGAEEPKQESKADDNDPCQETPKFRFKLTPYWEMRPGAERPYLIDELIPTKGIVVMWGPPKCLKSFIMLDMMFHVAKGWEYHDRAVHQGTVVYCAFEGGHGYMKRIEAQRRHYGIADDDRVPMPIMSGMANLISDHKLLAKEIAAQLGDTRPAAVVLDTLNKSLVGSESKDTDMANYIRAAEAIREAFRCVVIIVHHCGWDESRMRGHSSLPGALDAELAVVREGDIATVTVEHMRDGAEGTQVVVKLEVIEVGEDANGRPLTSLVVKRHDAGGNAPAQPLREWPASLKVFRAALVEALLGSGFDFKIENGPTVKAVELSKARAAFYKSYAVDSDDDSNVAQLQDSKKKAFARALERAQGLQLIAARFNDHRQIVWLVSPLDERYAL